MLLFWARVDLGAMTMKGYSASIKALLLLEPHHQIVLCHIQYIRWLWRDALVYSAAPADWETRFGYPVNTSRSFDRRSVSDVGLWGPRCSRSCPFVVARRGKSDLFMAFTKRVWGNEYGTIQVFSHSLYFSQKVSIVKQLLSYEMELVTWVQIMVGVLVV